ncbi:MAG: peptidylprolyl isomerase [Candidatus Zixiibacteriota bacterium]
MKKVITVLFALMFVLSVAYADDNATAKKPEAEKKEAHQKGKASNPEVAIETDFGTMKLELFRDVAPAHVDSMISRVKEKFYDGLIFHRIIPNFMIQGGDPKGTGTGNAGYTLPAEFSKLNHIKGTLSMARAQDPNSASCQFFICLVPTPHLDNQYTIFGQLMEGYDVLDKIGAVKTGPRDKPLEDVFIRKMYMIDDSKGEEKK